MLPATALAESAPALAQTGTPDAAATGTSLDAFAQEAARNSLSGVLMSSLALQKSKDERVRDYAWTARPPKPTPEG